jgi:peptidoglycan/LPS O-acetylase OafA/YrhL
MRYNPALDGLRAVAVLLVIGLHTNRPSVPGGDIGVDIFFVISGYLITSILLAEVKRTGSVSMRNFYFRRFLRLTPAFAIVLGAEAIRSLFVSNGQEIREAILVCGLYLENWNHVFSFSPTDLMGHTWSLATEEQFYLLWPTALLLILNKRPVVWLLAGVVIMTVAAFTFWRVGNWEMSHYSLIGRPIGLLVGCLLAFAPRLNMKGAGLVFLGALVAIALFTDDGPGVSCAAFVPLGASILAAALIASLTPGAMVFTALSFSPLRYVGRISYGLYLYHFPIFRLGEEYNPGWPFHLYALGLIALIFGAAALSYEFVEKPCLRLKDRLGTRQVMLMAIAAG